MKKLIRLTESDLHRIVKESVNRILMEMDANNEIENDKKSIPGYLPPRQDVAPDGTIRKWDEYIPGKSGRRALSLDV